MELGGKEITEPSDSDYVKVKITHIGFVDPRGVEGIMILHAEDGREFHMRAFSGEVAKHVARFMDGKKEEIPTVFKLVHELAENIGARLEKIKVYESGDVLRANLYFTGDKELVLRNFRASDAVALGCFYDSTILVRDSLLKEKMEAT